MLPKTPPSFQKPLPAFHLSVLGAEGVRAVCVTVCGVHTALSEGIWEHWDGNEDELAVALNKQSWCERCPPMRNANPAACGRALPPKRESGEEILVPGAVVALPMQV